MPFLAALDCLRGGGGGGVGGVGIYSIVTNYPSGWEDKHVTTQVTVGCVPFYCLVS